MIFVSEHSLPLLHRCPSGAVHVRVSETEVIAFRTEQALMRFVERLDRELMCGVLPRDTREVTEGPAVRDVIEQATS